MYKKIAGSQIDSQVENDSIVVLGKEVRIGKGSTVIPKLTIPRSV